MMSSLPSAGALFNQGFSVRDLRTVAEISGGQLMAYTKAPEAFARLTQGMGFQYLLAYAPGKPATDGKFRAIEVRVRRPGARVQYRHGYYASPRLVPLDRREFVTFSRIRAAARYDRAIDHIKVAITRTSSPAGGSRALDVEISVDVSRLSTTMSGVIRIAALDVAVYASTAKHAEAGGALSRVDLSFTEQAWQRALANGASFVIRMPLTADPRHVKAVVYDYGADLVGSVQIAR
ncbi:MAG: hypothetical protein M3R55_16880 [Acidobacteriota bacterium]|nr:hypothetical protein [Acidobacteriota bacterium]